MNERRLVLNRDGRRDSIAELLGIAVREDADAGIILIELGLQGVLRRVQEVVERRRLAEGEPAELDESAQEGKVAVPARGKGCCCAAGRCLSARQTDRRRIVGSELPARRKVGAQRAIGCLLAHVCCYVAAGAGDVIILGPGLQCIAAGEKRCERPIRMDIPLRPQEPTELQADVCARNVVKARAVEAADFHVFYWLGLDRKISCLPSRNRNQTGRGAEEEAFHHLHLEPPIVVPCGRVPSMARWNFTPLKPPSSPKSPSNSTPRKHQTNRLGVPPSVAHSP